ncbi:membrane protein insertase YidC [Acidisoma silvae]|uniref:Membrane protein insertase YidC n=1 Tax=Acidisoma silvae TaxID=2802396 RepID=A0A964DXA7_9PROT|nr:membrane protein insertase YidC [Acidisoma silvae]MCB8874006.1 membrane protein insertase YidC [Acidisoma silvae]
MEQKRLFIAIAASLVILLGFEFLVAPHLPHPKAPPPVASTTTPNGEMSASGKPMGNMAMASASSAASGPSPTVTIKAPSLDGSISLRGALLDNLVLTDYHETVDPKSPLVQMLSPQSAAQPYYVQYGWAAASGATIGGQPVRLPDSNTLWSASETTLSPAMPLTLSWDNGQGLTFVITYAVDDHYMFSVDQQVKNASSQSVALFPWSRIRREYMPPTSGFYLLHEGPIGVFNGTLHELGYKAIQKDGAEHDGVGYTETSDGGWLGFTDKYWATMLIPGQHDDMTGAVRAITANGTDGFQADFTSSQAQTIAPGGSASTASHVFSGAKVVRLLDHYEAEYHIPSFDKAVDFGIFYFLTKPIFFALDYLYRLLGNFGLAILAFTFLVKLLFFPLANKSYKSMSKMKLLAPKIKELRERYKDDTAKLQSETMALYRSEKANPASGCLPMVIQIPVFFCLYKVIFVTIEMRHAPFFGWIHDLSATDPTNIFTLFGLIPWDPMAIAPFLHLGAWPLIMGCTMYLQQKMNPPPPDPAQARLFQLMPIIFTFMLARFPAGLVIYWSWNNLLSVSQQWYIMRRTRLEKPRMIRTERKNAQG